MTCDDHLSYEETQALWARAKPIKVERRQPRDIAFLVHLPRELFQQLVEPHACKARVQES